MRWVAQKKPWWLAGIIAFSIGTICYWSDWVRFFGLYEIPPGDLIRNTGKALVGAVFLGIIFRHQRFVSCVGLLGPALIVRQYTIARDSIPGSNLYSFVIATDWVLTILITIVVLTSGATTTWLVDVKKGRKGVDEKDKKGSEGVRHQQQ